MSYKAVDDIISSLSTEIEKRRAVLNESQDHLVGIVDGDAGTDCDKNYWERNLGAIDAVIGLYDLLSGRDQSYDFNSVKIGSTFLDTGGLETSYLIANGSAAFNGSAVFNGPSRIVFSKGISSDVLSLFEEGLTVHTDSAYQLRNYALTGGAIGTGDDFNILELDAGNIKIGIPESLSYFQDTLGSGGAFRYRILDRTPFAVSANGRLSLNNLNYIDPNSVPGISILSDNNSGANGHIAIDNRTLEADDRVDALITLSNYLEHTTNDTVTQSIAMRTKTVKEESLFSFLIDSATVAQIDGYGNMTLTGGLDVVDTGTFLGGLEALGIVVTNAVECATVDTSGNVDVGGALDVIGISHLAGNVTSQGSILSSDGTRVAQIGYTSDEAFIAFFNGSIESRIAANSTDFGGALTIATEYDDIVLYIGDDGVRTDSVNLKLVGVDVDDVATIQFYSNDQSDDINKLFLDERGVVCVVSGQSVGPHGNSATGSMRTKGSVSSSVLITDQSALNIHCELQSSPVSGAIVVVKNSADSLLYWAYYGADGTNWIIIN